MTGNQSKCLDAGMDGYIPKQIRLETLIEAVECPGLNAGGEGRLSLGCGQMNLGEPYLSTMRFWVEVI